MARPNYGAANWSVNGPRALAWMRAEVPRRTTIVGIHEACVRALRLPVDRGRLSDYLSDTRRAEWSKIKLTLGTGNGAGPHAPAGASAGATPGAVASGFPSLAERIRLQRLNADRANCPVCQLSDELRSQIVEAKRMGATIAEILAELLKGDGVALAPTDWTRHTNGRHEQ
jgi:hypothetical protein